jgi:hypothetical protein
VKHYVVFDIARGVPMYEGRWLYQAAHALEPGTCWAAGKTASEALNRGMDEVKRFRDKELSKWHSDQT